MILVLTETDIEKHKINHIPTEQSWEKLAKEQ